ncbi:hypothetical protein BGW39_005723 [Mortierella sp. 14UC]|nr:hypothetical protein BGW39_005723 [Mortierella sp. 14UC]
MLQVAAEEHVQGFRAVHKSFKPSTVTFVDPDDIIHIDCYTDPNTHKDFILWDDIQQAFEEAQFVRHKTRMLPYLKGPDYRPLEPRRIAAVPGIVLDVVVGGDLEALTKVASPQQQFFPEKLQPLTPPQKEYVSAPSISTYNVDNVPAPTPSPRPLDYSPHVDYSLKVPVSQAMPGAFPKQQHGSDRPAKTLSFGAYRPIDLLPPLPPFPPLAATGKEAPLGGSHHPGKSTWSAQMPQSAEPGKRLHNPQDHSSADPTILSPAIISASRGDMDAQVALGDMYRDGRGVNQDYRTSVDWYLRAAEQGHIVAQANVGAAYEKGLGVPQDDERALKWSSRAAQHGSIPAQYLMGVMYEYGRGVPQDDFKAINWYLRAAHQQHVDSQRKVAELYEQGRGFPKDQAKAFEWYLKAAGQGHERSQYLVGNAYQEGKGVPKDSTKAVDWYLKAASQGHIQSQVKISEAYERGEGVPKDMLKAIEWSNKARNTGFSTEKTT